MAQFDGGGGGGGVDEDVGEPSLLLLLLLLPASPRGEEFSPRQLPMSDMLPTRTGA